MRIFAEVLGEGASNERGVIEKAVFSAFGRYIVGSLGNKADIIIQYYLIPYHLSTDSKTRDLE